ncbi:MAG TPA: hypothetical protein VF230_00980 [Acidimicrobiales bacterium]
MTASSTKPSSAPYGGDRSDALTVTFHGAAGTVTGSRFLAEHAGRRACSSTAACSRA